jgi:3-deoxy-D-manno-octulosonic acid kinase
MDGALRATMKNDLARDPPESRLEAERCVMLYDPSLAGNFTARWFDADYWMTAGAMRGSAPGRGSTHFFEYAGRSYALRHYRRGGLMARLSTDRYLDRGPERSRPLQEFRVTRRLQQLGLPVAPVVAARYAPSGFCYQGDLLTLRIAGATTLAALLGGAANPQLATQAAAIDWSAIGTTIARFHAVGLHHADLNAHNLLRAASGDWYLIDFDRARFREPGIWCDDSLVRLRRSLLKICDTTGVIFDEAWWHALLQGSGARVGR